MSKKDLTEKIFKAIIKASTIEDLEVLVEDESIIAHKFSEDKFPRLKFKLRSKDIALLRKKFINNDGSLKPQIEIKDPLAKLLYAAIWKNGGIKGLKHIVQGVMEVKDDKEKNDSLVFYQFGKHLTGEKFQPIVDRHIIRAFRVKNSSSEAEAQKLSKSNNKITKKEIDSYKEWLRDLDVCKKAHTDEALYLIDKILFSLGKTIK